MLKFQNINTLNIMSLAIILMPIFILSGPLIQDTIVILTSIFYLTRFSKNFLEVIKIYWLIIILVYLYN